MHRRADDPYASEIRGDVLITRAMPLVSYTLGVYGVADVVEFHAVPDAADAMYLENCTVKLPRRGGRWKPYPVEYKRGKPMPDDCDLVQLCAQALALEEMLNVRVEEGALFYGERERRVPVSFSADLRRRVDQLLDEMHVQFEKGATPPPRYAPRCKSCSLIELCMPRLKRSRMESYLQDYLADVE